VTHPVIAANNAAATVVRTANERRSRDAMAWFLLEALFALIIAVAIVWWTMGPKRRKPPRDPTNDTGNGRRR
jgi:hypothetical protein